MVATVDTYRESRWLQLDGITGQLQAAKMLGISRNTVRNTGKETQFREICELISGSYTGWFAIHSCVPE